MHILHAHVLQHWVPRSRSLTQKGLGRIKTVSDSSYIKWRQKHYTALCELPLSYSQLTVLQALNSRIDHAHVDEHIHSITDDCVWLQVLHSKNEMIVMRICYCYFSCTHSLLVVDSSAKLVSYSSLGPRLSPLHMRSFHVRPLDPKKNKSGPLWCGLNLNILAYIQ